MLAEAGLLIPDETDDEAAARPRGRGREVQGVPRQRLAGRLQGTDGDEPPTEREPSSRMRLSCCERLDTRCVTVTRHRTRHTLAGRRRSGRPARMLEQLTPRYDGRWPVTSRRDEREVQVGRRDAQEQLDLNSARTARRAGEPVQPRGSVPRRLPDLDELTSATAAPPPARSPASPTASSTTGPAPALVVPSDPRRRRLRQPAAVLASRDILVLKIVKRLLDTGDLAAEHPRRRRPPARARGRRPGPASP